MRQRILIAFATLLGALALTASSAYAAPSQAVAESTTAGNQIVQVGSTEADAQATCNYRVNVSGGVIIRSEPNVDSRRVGSLANGTRFSATCDNVEGQFYFDCPEWSALWKWVGNGYIKTKCLARV